MWYDFQSDKYGAQSKGSPIKSRCIITIPSAISNYIPGCIQIQKTRTSVMTPSKKVSKPAIYNTQEHSVHIQLI